MEITTHDGHLLKEGDPVFSVREGTDGLGMFTGPLNKVSLEVYPDAVYFKDKSNAIAYLKEHRKTISLADIKRLMKPGVSANYVLNELYPIAWGSVERMYNKR